jgi:hypothetical protein
VAGLRRVSILRPIPLAASAVAAALLLLVGSLRTQPLAGLDLSALGSVIRISALAIVGLFALSLLPILQARPITSLTFAQSAPSSSRRAENSNFDN